MLQKHLPMECQGGSAICIHHYVKRKERTYGIHFSRKYMIIPPNFVLHTSRAFAYGVPKRLKGHSTHYLCVPPNWPYFDTLHFIVRGCQTTSTTNDFVTQMAAQIMHDLGQVRSFIFALIAWPCPNCSIRPFGWPKHEPPGVYLWWIL